MRDELCDADRRNLDIDIWVDAATTRAPTGAVDIYHDGTMVSA